MKNAFFVSALFLLSAAAVQAAPDYFSQINAYDLPAAATGSGVIVAVLDSGVDIDHPDLRSNIWINPNESVYQDGIDNDNNGYIDDIWGWDFTLSTASAGRNDPRPKFDRTYDSGEFSHGTAIAGYIAARANEYYSTAGLAPQAKIMALRVLSGNGEGDVNQVVAAIKYAVSNGASVINLSFVGFDDSPKLREAVRYAYDHNVVVVAAAGNGTETSQYGVNLNTTPAYPVCYGTAAIDKQLLATAAVDSNGQKSSFSNYGSNCINISAPGKSLRGLAFSSSSAQDFGFGYAVWSGTSFSAALVSAAAALVKSVRPDLTAAQVIDILTHSASSLAAANPYLNSGELGFGELNVKAAVQSAQALNPARLVKTKNYSAVYLVDAANTRHLFVNRQVYDSWFASWKTPPLITVITQDDFDKMSAGINVQAKPGSLAKFSSGSKSYEVINGSALCPMADSAAGTKAFGKDWQKKVIDIPMSDFINYGQAANCLIKGAEDVAAIAPSELIISK